eukprot:9928315-Prorocentrum_lima.AAC.1
MGLLEQDEVNTLHQASQPSKFPAGYPRGASHEPPPVPGQNGRHSFSPPLGVHRLQAVMFWCIIA